MNARILFATRSRLALKVSSFSAGHSALVAVKSNLMAQLQA